MTHLVLTVLRAALLHTLSQLVVLGLTYKATTLRWLHSVVPSVWTEATLRWCCATSYSQCEQRIYACIAGMSCDGQSSLARALDTY